jgi:hypothetical protein
VCRTPGLVNERNGLIATVERLYQWCASQTANRITTSMAMAVLMRRSFPWVGFRKRIASAAAWCSIFLKNSSVILEEGLSLIAVSIRSPLARISCPCRGF